MLISEGANDQNTVRSIHNLEKTKSIRLENINILDLMAYKNLMLSQASIGKLAKILEG